MTEQKELLVEQCIRFREPEKVEIIALDNYNNVLKDNNLTNNEKLLLFVFFIVVQNSNNVGNVITNSNDDLAKKCSLTTRTISTLINSLCEKGFIAIAYSGNHREIMLNEIIIEYVLK